MDIDRVTRTYADYERYNVHSSIFVLLESQLMTIHSHLTDDIVSLLAELFYIQSNISELNFGGGGMASIELI